MKLYIYDHCPFCVRARMILGLKNLPYERVVLLNDDEDTPMRLVGKKLLPILELAGAEVIGESLDIVRHVDTQGATPVLVEAQRPEITRWIDKASGSIFKLAMPRWAEAPLDEFASVQARAYFVANKSRVFGPLEQLRKDTRLLKQQAEADLVELDALLVAANRNGAGVLSLDDILLFPILRALSIVSGVLYPPAVDDYRKTMASRCGVPLHDAIAC